MKDKRTYDNLKEHGEDMSHENESKLDTTPIQLLTEQYKADINKYQEREGLYIKTENQLKATKQIVIEMAGTVRQIHIENENLKAEVSRLLKEIQLLETKIKK